MSDKLIPGGYVLLSRKLIESEIWNKPPLYLKIWIYLLSKAQHQDYKNLKRGQLWTSIPEIQKACCWYVGFRKEIPSKDQVYQVIEWLRSPIGKISRDGYESNDASNNEPTMIATTKAMQGILVNIVKYGIYQNSKNYESNDESNDVNATNPPREQRQPDNINKNDKNNKNNNILSTKVDMSSCDNESEIDYQQIINLFHSSCISLPQVKVLTPKRKQTIRARVKEHGQEAVSEMLTKASQSCFLAGQNNKGWVASFDWIFRPENFIKVLEGNYSNKEPVKQELAANISHFKTKTEREEEEFEKAKRDAMAQLKKEGYFK